MSSRSKHEPLPANSTRARRRTSPHHELPADAPLLNFSEWCRRHGFSQNTGRILIAEGMPTITVDRHVRIEPARAMEWLRARSAELKGMGVES